MYTRLCLHLFLCLSVLWTNSFAPQVSKHWSVGSEISIDISLGDLAHEQGSLPTEHDDHLPFPITEEEESELDEDKLGQRLKLLHGLISRIVIRTYSVQDVPKVQLEKPSLHVPVYLINRVLRI